MYASDNDDYAPPTRTKGKMLAVAASIVGLLAVVLIGFVILAKTRGDAGQAKKAPRPGTSSGPAQSSQSRPTFTPSVKDSLARLKAGGKITDETLARHAFWKQPLSKTQLTAILDRLCDPGRRDLPLIVDDEGRMVDDDRKEYSLRYLTALKDGKICDRWVSLPYAEEISDALAREMLFVGMNKLVASEKYNAKHPR